MLHQLFPNKPRAVLDHIAAQNPGRLVLELTEMVLAHEYPLEVYRLYEAVEGRDLDQIYCEYIENGCDYERTIKAMGGTAGAVSGTAGAVSGTAGAVSGTAGGGTAGSTTGGTTGGGTRNDDIQQVQTLLGVDAATAKQHWDGAVGSTIVAVVKAMVIPQEKRTTPGRISRVQGRGARSGGSGAGGSGAGGGGGGGSVAAELGELLESPEVAALDRQFVEKLYRVVDRDLGRWLAAVEAVVAGGALQHTWDYPALEHTGTASGGATASGATAIGDNASPFKIVMLPRERTKVSSYISSGGSGTGSRRQAVRNTASPGATTASSSLTIDKIDLHGQRVDEAVRTARVAVESWWNSEETSRINDGRLHKFHTTASFVPPLRIVTGRGIHSEGGYSRIKVAVRRYLDEAQYVYDEHSWGMAVTGRRTGR